MGGCLDGWLRGVFIGLFAKFKVKLFSVFSPYMINSLFFHKTGSGKTSLLDVIACRNKSGEVTGKVMLNGVSRTAEMLSKCAAYVRQDDRLMASLTVRETLMFVAQLKLPKSFDAEETKARVSPLRVKLYHVVDASHNKVHYVLQY